MKMHMASKNPLELYLHIPFCVRKCRYCDFLSGPAEEPVKRAYVKALARELEVIAPQAAEYEIVSVYIGGGTPSLLKAEEIALLMRQIRKGYRLSKEAEISMEINPGTAEADRLKGYFQAGINRISIGLQSALNEELKRLGRIHSYEDFLKTYEQAGEAGFTNINVDIMSAIPGQTVADYEKTLEAVLSLHPLPEHISAYSLIVEEGTEFGALAEAGTLLLPDEETDRLMYARTAEQLKQKGYERYEISNYARSGYRCLHNCGYWERKPYLGFGVGAASLFRGERFRNGESLTAYLAKPEGVRTDLQQLTSEEEMEEYMFLGLRLTQGVGKKKFEELFHRPMEQVYGKVLRKNEEDGLLVCQGDRVRLTEKGLDLSNYVMAQFLL